MQEPTQSFDIICLSHLKWEETLFQRPQQIMKQMARRHRAVYVANIGTRDFLRAVMSGNRRAVWGEACENLTYLNVPFFPLTKRFPLFRWLTARLTVLCARFLAWRRGFRSPCLWVYHPVYFPHVRLLPRWKLVYDCMDQFEAFDKSPASDKRLEAALLSAADVVFTGGKTLQKAKAGVNPRTYCFPSGVEVEHFARAAAESTPVAEDVASIRHPILGYFGAVDERIDFGLIRYLCEQRPHWSVVFIGPLVRFEKCPVESANFHYLGKKEYGDLPRYLKAFDVCLMPFVDSELTRHISPTKTPEYLAGGKPVVSSPVPDVVEGYSDVVRIAGTHQGFVAEVEAALREKKGPSRARFEEKVVAKSWERIALEMERLL
jgi:glycosyltransferase involved in cell wall biosynthesis